MTDNEDRRRLVGMPVYTLQAADWMPHRPSYLPACVARRFHTRNPNRSLRPHRIPMQLHEANVCIC